jgi:hypothetical protein
MGLPEVMGHLSLNYAEMKQTNQTWKEEDEREELGPRELSRQHPK